MTLLCILLFSDTSYISATLDLDNSYKETCIYLFISIFTFFLIVCFPLPFVPPLASYCVFLKA